ncbi:hypothetical protein PG984_013557 [Apiospora sp. TS-2023a]
MHLINVHTLQLESFMDQAPPYAILSHTWVDGEEVSFQELQIGACLDKSGYTKIENCCSQAKLDGLSYAWRRMSSSRISVAERMSWAATRQTTRGEDLAYSLLGIFGVSMSLLYGEVAHVAFRRLQEEIIRTSNDLSIFTWNTLEQIDRSSEIGVLSSTVSQFANTSNVPILASSPSRRVSSSKHAYLYKPSEVEHTGFSSITVENGNAFTLFYWKRYSRIYMCGLVDL